MWMPTRMGFGKRQDCDLQLKEKSVLEIYIFARLVPEHISEYYGQKNNIDGTKS